MNPYAFLDRLLDESAEMDGAPEQWTTLPMKVRRDHIAAFMQARDVSECFAEAFHEISPRVATALLFMMTTERPVLGALWCVLEERWRGELQTRWERALERLRESEA